MEWGADEQRTKKKECGENLLTQNTRPNKTHQDGVGVRNTHTQHVIAKKAYHLEFHLSKDKKQKRKSMSQQVSLKFRIFIFQKTKNI